MEYWKYDFIRITVFLLRAFNQKLSLQIAIKINSKYLFFIFCIARIKGIGRNVGRTFEIEAYVEKKIGELQKNRVSRVSRGEALLILVKLKINLSNISFYLT